MQKSITMFCSDLIILVQGRKMVHCWFSRYTYRLKAARLYRVEHPKIEYTPVSIRFNKV